MWRVPGFEWDPRKDHLNQRKHGVSFSQAIELFANEVDCLERHDERHSTMTETRYLATGACSVGILVVSYTEPADDTVRIISARPATPRERRQYERYLGERR